MLAAKFFSSSYDEDHEVTWSQNPKVYKTQQLLQEKDELGHMSLVHNMFVKNFCIFALAVTALKTIFIYV